MIGLLVDVVKECDIPLMILLVIVLLFKDAKCICKNVYKTSMKFSLR